MLHDKTFKIYFIPIVHFTKNIQQLLHTLQLPERRELTATFVLFSLKKADTQYQQIFDKKNIKVINYEKNLCFVQMRQGFLNLCGTHYCQNVHIFFLLIKKSSKLDLKKNFFVPLDKG
jgi:hypothetical protein